VLADRPGAGGPVGPGPRRAGLSRPGVSLSGSPDGAPGPRTTALLTAPRTLLSFPSCRAECRRLSPRHERCTSSSVGELGPQASVARPGLGRPFGVARLGVRAAVVRAEAGLGLSVRRRLAGPDPR